MLLPFYGLIYFFYNIPVNVVNTTTVTADDSLLIAMLEQDPVSLVKPGAVLLKTPLHLPPLSGLLNECG